jgi:FMN phosphatase YigB (HAD superfamily)
VDDAEVNVEAAQTLGMRGVVYRVDRDHDLAALLAELGVRP